jgi:hypothetical protein
MALPPPRLCGWIFEIRIACRVGCRPVAQRVPIAAHNRLLRSGIAVTVCAEQRTIGVAHYVLTQRVETMQVMLEGPGRWLTGVHGEVVATEILLCGGISKRRTLLLERCGGQVR